jgi:hypothetical protein
MLKPPSSTMPGMTDTLDFVKNLWGSMNIPGTGIPGMPGMSGLAAPTLSTDDLDKRIADLKAVESWLNMNIGMLRGTIQAMEVQRGTLATLKSMGASMAEAMRQSGVSADKMAGMPFAPFFNPAPAPAAGKPSAAPSSPAPGASPASGAAPAQGHAAPGHAPGQSSGNGGAAASAGADSGAAAAMGMPAAVAWWNLLQDQFRQAVTSAMNSAASAAAAPGAPATPPASPAPEAPPAKPAAPASASAPGPQAEPGNNGTANGKPRASRSRADKA